MLPGLSAGEHLPPLPTTTDPEGSKMATTISNNEKRAVEMGLMTIDEDGRRRCMHDQPVYDWCHRCTEGLNPPQLRLMGKTRAATIKETRQSR